jgi:hypothetical protein
MADMAVYRLPRTAALARRDSEGSAANLNLDLGMLQIFYNILLISFTIFFYLYILQYSTSPKPYYRISELYFTVRNKRKSVYIFGIGMIGGVNFI